MLESAHSSPSLFDYNYIRRDRTNRDKDHGGGLLTFIRTNIQYKAFRLNSVPTNLEYMQLK